MTASSIDRFRTIVAGTDFRPEAAAAVDLATAIARAARARLVLVHAIDTSPPLPYIQEDVFASERERVATLARMDLAQMVSPLRALGIDVETRVVPGKPFVALSLVAADCTDPLLVVGTRALGGAQRLLLGSTAERLVRKAPVLVLVAKGGAREAGIQRILVGIDFSECSFRALEAAVALGAALKAAIVAAHAVELPPIERDMSRAADVRRQVREKAEQKLLEAVRARFPENGSAARGGLPAGPLPPIAVRAIETPAAESLVLAAERLGADVIAVGSVGRSGVSALFVGNTAESVLRAADRPVLVVKPAWFRFAL